MAFTLARPHLVTIFIGDYFKDRLPVILNHAQYLIEHKGERVGTREIRKHILAYVKGVHGAKPYKKYLSTVESLDQIKTLLTEIADVEFQFDSERDLMVA